jgi:uncharacterized protein (TIGR00255 family)
MTGFAALSREAGGCRASVTVKSVNHRFLDIALKAPSTVAAVEGRIRASIQQRLTRGRVEIAVSLESTSGGSYKVTLNEPLLERVSAALDDARERGLVSGGMTVADLLRLPQVLQIAADTGGDVAPEDALELVVQTVGEAADALAVMRLTEGGFLRKDLDQRVAQLASLIDEVDVEARAAQDALEARLRDRLSALPADLVADPVAVSQEVVRFVSRSDIDEELVRLRGHFAHWRALVDGDEPCGRKLDFLVQEMNREVNTIGSKAEGTRVPELVVTAKAELERVKEQVQNVE